VHLTYKRKNGKTAMVETRFYRRYTGVPILQSRTTYQYGEKNGEWGVTSRSETRRRNISVRFSD